MVTFSIPVEHTRIVVKNTKSFFCAADLDIPEAIRETLSLEELSRACGLFLLAFYLPPYPGTSFDHEGHCWMVDRVHESVKRYKTRGERCFPVLTCSYLGRLDNPTQPTVDGDD